jgi:hypothetical protein
LVLVGLNNGPEPGATGNSGTWNRVSTPRGQTDRTRDEPVALMWQGWWSCWGLGQEAETLDAAQDGGEQGAGDNNFRHLKHYTPGMMDDLGPDLDELVP